MLSKKRKKIKILFLDILTDDEKLRRLINAKVYNGGTYSEDMRKAFGLKKNEWVVVDASCGKLPGNITRFSGVVIGGSMEDPVNGREKKWVKKTYPFIQQVIKNKIPLLGICGGLQFTVRALGGKVVYNPKGREYGSIKISLTNAGIKDQIFSGLSRNVNVQASHKCMAAGLKPGWKLLASSKICHNQAIAIGGRIRLVQFHPEMKIKELRAIANMRKRAFIKEGFVRNERYFKKFIDSIRDTSGAGKKILRNFLKFFVLPNH